MQNIEKYFQKKKIVANSTTNSEDGKKKNEIFYEECLQENIEVTATHESDSHCEKEKPNIEEKINEIKEKIKKIENAINSCQIIIAEKDNKIEKLRNKLPDKINTQPEGRPQLMFESFSKDLKIEAMAVLRSIKPTIECDSKFILNAVKYLYAEKLETLKNKTACGRGQGKEMMTPSKKKLLDDLFEERLRGIGVGTQEQVFRKKQLNKLIKYSFFNITKQLISQNIAKETCRQLNFDDLNQ